MRNKRGNKEGTIYKRTNGKWRAQVYLNGGRLSHTSSTRAEAQEWLRNTQNQIDSGLTLKGAQKTYGEFLSEWLITASKRLAPTTLYSYEQLVRVYIQPALGHYKLRQLNPVAIQQFYNRKVAEGVGVRTVEKAHNVIHASINAAVKMGLIGRNPDDATQPPRPTKKEMKFLNPEQVRRLLQVAKESDDRNYALYFTAIATGMRQGELLGLRWNDVDLDKDVLNVRLALVRMPGGNLTLQKPKTKSSVRSIQLGKKNVKILQEQKRRLAMEAEATHLWQERGHVFPSRIGTPIDPTNLTRQFKHLLKAAGLSEVRFHDLRHTAATLMLNNGVDLLIASRRLGHAKPSITLDVYGHLLPSMQGEAAEVLDNLISG